MGCDIHIVIERQDADGVWSEIVWQNKPWRDDDVPVAGIPVAPEVFDSRNYHKFAILADVRNGLGFAGIKTCEGWPSIAADRGFPPDFDAESVATNPAWPTDGPRSLGDHSFTWVSLDELKAFPWDTTESWLYGVVPAKEYERLTVEHDTPVSYCGDTSGPGIVVYEPDAYRLAKANGTLSERPHVRMGWPRTARDASYDWPGKVLPWLDTLAEGRPLRLVMGFDS